PDDVVVVGGAPYDVVAVGAAAIGAPHDVVVTGGAPDDVVVAAGGAPDDVVVAIGAPDDVVVGLRLGGPPGGFGAKCAGERVELAAAQPVAAPDDLLAPDLLGRRLLV